jgi:adhesin/invasin
VYILQDGGTNIIQKVDLFTNTITGGTAGVRIQRTGGSSSLREITIGNSVANSNRISSNTDWAVRLQGYSADIAAEYNDWGMCTLREIEDKIRHDYDSAALGEVDYEPAICVPFTIDVDADPTSLPADGVSTSKITAIARDAAGNRVLPGTMIGITTNLGTVPWGHAEAEGGDVTVGGAWTVLNAPAYQLCSNGGVRRSGNPASSLTWSFTGEAVSLIYMKRTTAGSVDVWVDGIMVTTIDTASPTADEFRVEDVIATWPSEGAHTIEVRPAGTGNVFIDAFRSGGIVKSNGRVRTDLTAATVPGVAEVWGSVYDGHIVTAASAVTTPVVTDFVTVTFQAADLYVTKSVVPASINSGQEVTYTISYGNNGPETATDTVITDTLPTDFVYVRSSSSPDFEPPTLVGGDKVVWDVGDLGVGVTGTITLVARPDPSMLWCSPVLRTNGAEIAAGVPDAILGNNSSGPVNVNVLVPTGLAVTAHPPSIPVSNGNVTTTLRITVTDSNSNLVDGIPVVVTTTDGIFVKSGGTTATVTTSNGVAFADLASDTTVTTATVTAEVMPTCGGMPSTTLDVPFVAALPYSATTTASATLIRVCGDTSVVTATVYDSFGNLVEDGTEVQFLVVPGERGYMDPEWVQTVNGEAVSTLHSGDYMFGERHLTIKIQARRGTQRELAELRIDLRPGLPEDIGLTPSPPVIAVGGDQSIIRAFVSDCAGNAVEDGTGVTFAANGLGTISPTLTTTNGGLAYATFKSLCTIGTATISATANGAAADVELPLTAGPADHFGSVTLQRNTIRNCGHSTEISALVYDRCFNLVEDNTLVVFGVAFDLVTVSPNPALTRNGQVIATITSLNNPLHAWPKSHEQVGLASGAALPSFVDMWIEPGDPAVMVLSADPDSIPINGVANFYDIIVEAEINDCSGTPITDTTPVTLQTDTGLFRESGTWAIVRPSISGMVTATLTSEERAGDVTITATVDSILETTQVTFLPDEPYHVDVWGVPFNIAADGHSRTQVTAWVRDYYYNPVLPGITVTFVADHGHWWESGGEYYTTTTTTGGYAFANLVSTRDYVGTVNIYAITYNGRLGPGIVQFTTPRYYYLPLISRKAQY